MLSEVKWPRKISVGKATVTVYKRTRANGTPGYEVANYSLGKRKFESFPNEDAALARAHELATQLSERAVLSTAFIPPRDLDSIRKHRKNIAELAAFHHASLGRPHHAAAQLDLHAQRVVLPFPAFG